MFGRRDKSTGRPTPEGNPGMSGVFGGPPAAGQFGHDELPSDDAELMHTLRSRLMDRLPASPPDVTFGYARQLGPLHEVLCRDLPETVSTLSDQALAGRDVELFFAAARRNTELEPSDLQQMPTKSGIDLWLLEGDGFFVASQLPWLPKRIAERPPRPTSARASWSSPRAADPSSPWASTTSWCCRPCRCFSTD